MALFSDGSPVIDREGMLLRGRRTLVRALASTSIGVGGDSLLTVEGVGREARVRTGPLRQGPALAFGGAQATLLDALNALDGEAIWPPPAREWRRWPPPTAWRRACWPKRPWTTRWRGWFRPRANLWRP